MKTSGPQKTIIVTGFCILSFVLIIKLFIVQIVNKEYKVTASNNVLKYDVIYPTRGLVYDRNGLLLLDNSTAYDILVTPSELKAFDTAGFCSIFSLSRGTFDRMFEKIMERRRKIGYQSVIFLRQVGEQEYARFLELSYKFPGFNAQSRNVRNYPLSSAGSLLGYMVEVDNDFLQKHPQYKVGDYTGKSGLEETYEDYLKGEKGYSIYLRDVFNRIKAPYKDGEFDKTAVPGKDMVITIDAVLQAFGEQLMQNKVGSLIAIEPATGEILSLVSSPGLETFQVHNIGKYYAELSTDPLRPLFNRAFMSLYPPGSVFKLVNGLIGLQEGVVRPQTLYPCNMGYKVGRGVGCHAHKSPINLIESVQMSCNAYYCHVFRNILDNPAYPSLSESFKVWREYVKSFGFGQKLGSDFPAEKGGTLPTAKTYDRVYGKGHWSSLTVISLAIGQGEIGATPLQLANLAAIMANRGYYFSPHIVREIKDTVWANPYTEKHYTKIDTSLFSVIVEGMSRAVNSPEGAGGTARIARLDDIEICGKTGTAQNPHGSDHSVFICFAPRENPMIAVAAYIEQGGFGATWAAPIASLMVEKYLKGEIKGPVREAILKRVLEGNLLYKFERKP